MLSIIIITYNRSGLLIQTVKSILNQTYCNFELILVDDGSTDNTKEVINSLSDSRIKYYNFGKIGNLSKLRNLGIRQSEFEYIAFCDDDDLWSENKIELQMKRLGEYKLICSNAEVIDEDSKVIKERYFELFENDFRISKEHLLKVGNSILTSSLLLEKKILYEKNMFFDELNVTNYCEDYELFLRLSEYYDILFIGNNLVKKRLHSSVSGGPENNLIMLRASIGILNKYTGKGNSPDDKHAIEGILGFKQLMVLISFKLNPLKGLTELSEYILYIIDPKVFNIFLKTKLLKKIKKLIKSGS